LAGKGQQLDELRKLAREQPLTLLYAAHDEAHNNAIVLQEELKQ